MGASLRCSNVATRVADIDVYIGEEGLGLGLGLQYVRVIGKCCSRHWVLDL